MQKPVIWFNPIGIIISISLKYIQWLVERIVCAWVSFSFTSFFFFLNFCKQIFLQILWISFVDLFFSLHSIFEFRISSDTITFFVRDALKYKIVGKYIDLFKYTRIGVFRRHAKPYHALHATIYGMRILWAQTIDGVNIVCCSFVFFSSFFDRVFFSCLFCIFYSFFLLFLLNSIISGSFFHCFNSNALHLCDGEYSYSVLWWVWKNLWISKKNYDEYEENENHLTEHLANWMCHLAQWLNVDPFPIQQQCTTNWLKKFTLDTKRT